ncbi:hypothetical protein STIV2_A105 [Sulfolobus turreted icosahedral virus 2]|uniref:Uncharacterized protein n=1 Tax=Sulfolobus turreted icosahedral virus 2 TaxID=754004 RepID=D5IEY6_9VIRU|nr:hypothetical protein STIV2_A105 [Sulfolobus turreted icosahedral virus 2]ADF27758.1 hypothetical protein STIV2_A105 [Sulfolobus turreted icosahedral virus 2]
MSDEEVTVQSIKDEKLRQSLIAYRETKNPLLLLSILDYLDVKIKPDAISAIIPEFQINDPKSISLGGIILHGRLFRVVLIVHDYIHIDMHEATEILHEVKKNEKD